MNIKKITFFFALKTSEFHSFSRSHHIHCFQKNKSHEYIQNENKYEKLKQIDPIRSHKQQEVSAKCKSGMGTEDLRKWINFDPF